MSSLSVQSSGVQAEEQDAKREGKEGETKPEPAQPICLSCDSRTTLPEIKYELGKQTTSPPSLTHATIQTLNAVQIELVFLVLS